MQKTKALSLSTCNADSPRKVARMHRQGRNNQQIMRATGVGRCRAETWTRLGYLPDRNRMEPRPGMPAASKDYLAQRWSQGCRQGKDLLKEVREQGYKGCYSALVELLSPWRTSPPAPSSSQAVVTTSATPARRLAPQVAAALLAKHPGEFTATGPDGGHSERKFADWRAASNSLQHNPSRYRPFLLEHHTKCGAILGEGRYGWYHSLANEPRWSPCCCLAVGSK